MRQTILSLCILTAFSGSAFAQGMQMGEVIMLSHPVLNKDVTAEEFRVFVNQRINSAQKKEKAGNTLQLFKADRGNRKGEFLLVYSSSRSRGRESRPGVNPFTDKLAGARASRQLSDFVTNASAFTEYSLIGADKLKSLPVAGILGIHYIKIKQERTTEFEKFVVDKLHPAVANLFPDMQLLYYKAVDGDNTGSYITIFTIESVAARDKYWPAGAPETEVLKQTFKPLEPLAKELGTYLVEDSYLEPESGGAAAYWESREWTDFIHPDYLK
jgi:hypothetical protein